jgi:hypothetical protein
MNLDFYVNTWSNAPGMPPDTCQGDIHVFRAWSNLDSEGTVCDCGKARWTFVTCDHCHQKRGESVPNDKID